MKIQTASWFASLPTKTNRVSISRSAPRRESGYRALNELKPGRWFRSVSPQEFLELYSTQLLQLNAEEVFNQLASFGSDPTLLCWEKASDCQAGTHWCHRHICAQWLEDRLGIKIPELGYPELDRFALLRKNGIEPPDFRVRKRKRNIKR